MTCYKRYLYMKVLMLNAVYWVLSIFFMFVEGDLITYRAQVHALGSPIVITSISFSFYIAREIVPSRYPLATFNFMFIIGFLLISLQIHLAV